MRLGISRHFVRMQAAKAIDHDGDARLTRDDMRRKRHLDRVAKYTNCYEGLLETRRKNRAKNNRLSNKVPVE